MEEIILSGRMPNADARKSKISKLKKEQISSIILYFFILLYTYASLRVLSDYPMFVREVYSLIVWEPVKWGFAVICIAEIITVFSLIIPKLRYVGFILTFVVMFVVNISSMIVLQKAPIIPFLFGGIFPTVDFWEHLYINLFLLVVALVGLLLFISSRNTKNNLP